MWHLDTNQIVDVVDFGPASAQVYGQIRFVMRQRGQPIGEMDILIAAVAMADGATLVTHNTKHFGRIEGLPVEDWLE